MSAMANASDGESPGAVRPTVLAKVRAKHMRSHAVITLDDEENLISSLVPASNFFHCAYALVLDTSRPIYARLLGLTLSIAVVCVQLLVLMAAYRATMVGSCLDNLDCVARGSFCRESTRQCDRCQFGYGANSSLGTACGAGETAEEWLANQPSTVMEGRFAGPPTLVDHAAHCAGCVGVYMGSRRPAYTWAAGYAHANVAGMGWRDWLAFVTVSGIVGLFAAKEVRDVKVCEALARSRSGVGIGWHLGLGFVSSLRQHSVVVSVFASVVLSLFTLGGNVLTTCMTSISLLFLLEVDDILYQHAVPEWAKAWCSEHAAASLGAADLHTISWLRIAYTLLFATCIPGVAAVRLRLPSEGGETYSGTALTYVAVPATVAVAILVEPLALLVAGRSGWRAAAGRFGRCVLRFLVGFLLWTLLLQVIDR